MDQTINDGIVAMDRDVVKVSKWQISIVIILIIEMSYSIWWAGGINTQVQQASIIQTDVETALVMLAEYRMELHGMRDEQSRIRKKIDSMNELVNEKTSDRFRRHEFNTWKVDFARYLDVRFEKMEQGIQIMMDKGEEP